MGYCILTKDIVIGKFFISMIDELQDELPRMIVFFKLDLKSWYHCIRVGHEDDSYWLLNFI